MFEILRNEYHIHANTPCDDEHLERAGYHSENIENHLFDLKVVLSAISAVGVCNMTTFTLHVCMLKFSRIDYIFQTPSPGDDEPRQVDD